MNSAVIAPRIARISTNSVLASRNASRLRFCSSSSVKTGTNAALSAASANSERTRLGTWKAIVKAENAPEVPKYDDATISRTSPAIRERPVAAEKIAVLRAMPRRPARAAREPPLHVDDQDVLPPPGGRSRRRRRHEGRHRSPRVDLADRQGRQDGRPAPQQRGTQEEPRGAGAPRRRERLALP